MVDEYFIEEYLILNALFICHYGPFYVTYMKYVLVFAMSRRRQDKQWYDDYKDKENKDWNHPWDQ